MEENKRINLTVKHLLQRVSEKIKDVLFDEKFLRDFNERGMNMQEVMAYGPEAIDVVARCLALKHISILELVEEEQERRRARQRAEYRDSARV